MIGYLFDIEVYVIGLVIDQSLFCQEADFLLLVAIDNDAVILNLEQVLLVR